MQRDRKVSVENRALFWKMEKQMYISEEQKRKNELVSKTHVKAVETDKNTGGNANDLHGGIEALFLTWW